MPATAAMTFPSAVVLSKLPEAIEEMKKLVVELFPAMVRLPKIEEVASVEDVDEPTSMRSNAEVEEAKIAARAKRGVEVAEVLTP